MPSVTLVIERYTVNKTTKAQEHVREIARSIKNRAKVGGTEAHCIKMAEPTRVLQNDTERWRYQGKIRLERVKDDKNTSRYLDIATIYIRKAAEARGWMLLGDAADIREQEVAAAVRPPFIVPVLTNDDIKRELEGIYFRDSHIKIIHLSAKMGADTKMKKRSHVLAYGQPAAAKTILFQKLKAMYEKNDGVERVAMLDATTVTKAGLERWLMEKSKAGTLPEILCLEEIEKYEPNNLLCLLSIMDARGSIQKTNALVGSITAKTPLIIWATCNDEGILKNFHKGALWSRFSHRIKCVRPNREVMVSIMLDKIKDLQAMGIDIHNDCAKIAVDYAFDVLKTNDPRAIEALLDSCNMLLDGSYFAMLEDIKKQAEDEAKLQTSFQVEV